MSQRALMLACRDHLRTQLELTSNECEVMFDAQPMPIAGETFVSVHPGSWQVQYADADLDETYGVNVTVTRRLGFAPQDRWGPEVWAKANTGLEELLRRIIVQVHYSHTIREAAEAFLADGSGRFATPPLLESVQPPQPKGADWFSASEDASGRVPNAGIAQTLVFGGAQRVQDLAIMA